MSDVARARRIILTDEGPGADTNTRWETETPYLAGLVDRFCGLGRDSLLLDYGCGIGRLAREAIARHGCGVLGVDTSAGMRDLARQHVGSDRFIALSPDQFDTLVGAGLRVDAFICVWVLQHCMRPADDVARIAGSLRDDGHGFVLNMRRRAIPAVMREGAEAGTFRWLQDRTDVRSLLGDVFDVEQEERPDPALVPNSDSYWLALRGRRAGASPATQHQAP